MGKYKLINKFTLISSLFIILILTTGMSIVLVVKYLRIYILNKYMLEK